MSAALSDNRMIDVWSSWVVCKLRQSLPSGIAYAHGTRTVRCRAGIMPGVGGGCSTPVHVYRRSFFSENQSLGKILNISTSDDPSSFRLNAGNFVELATFLVRITVTIELVPC